MIYYLIGILCIVALEIVMTLKQYENNININNMHIFSTAVYYVYLIFVIEYFHDRPQMNIINIFLMFVLFAPLTIAGQLIFNRFKQFAQAILLSIAAEIYIMILQKIDTGKINILFLFVPLLGGVAGFIVGKMIRNIFPRIRRFLIIRKRKRSRLSKVNLFELEITCSVFMIMFLMISTIEAFSGNNFDEKLNKTLKYEVTNKKDKYKNIYFADQDKYERYEAYRKANPEMELEDVVWRVDANLDQKFYDDAYIKYSDASTDEPLLINKFNRVRDDFKPKNLVTIECRYVATEETVDAYKMLTGDLKKEGMKIYVVSSYRDIKYQNRLYNNYLKSDKKEVVDTYSSRPGFSEHHTGRALDVSQVSGNLNVFEGSPEAKWVYENAYKYGFIVRYKENQMDVTGYIFEPWHIVYVGKDISQTMHDENIETLEEYVVKYIDHTPGKE